ncbi:MAG: glycosyltransferase family 4 protein [Pseudomonadota bacterium]
MPVAAAFAIPGDITTLTGGYIYERRLLEGLRKLGHAVHHIQLGSGFPDPSQADMRDAVGKLQAIPADQPLILDGLVYGSIATDGLAGVSAPIVGMIHHPLALESGLSKERADHLFRTERANLALADHVLVPSPHTASILRADYGVDPRAITIARPGTDKPKPSADTQRSDPFLILSVGIQHPRKGHDILLRALGQLAGLDWRAVIVGSAYDHDHANELQQLREELGLQERVRLAGRVEAEELDSLYRQASLFALATRYEGYGIVFDEALAYGLPIVSCDTGAVSETVPADAGVLVQPEDAHAFAAALSTLLADEERRSAMVRAALMAGASLPGWGDTARVASGVLERVALPAAR